MENNNQFIKIVLGMGIILIALILQQCKENDLPDNPYDGLISNVTPPVVDTTSEFSIKGLHKNIFSPQCANPGCHDGTFEPDYRTIQSTYSTLVYHSVIKNNQGGTFKYRVVPYDTVNSWLHERLVTGDSVLGQMPIYSTPLEQKEIDNVNKWIMNGAKDMFGVPAVKAWLPNAPPVVAGYAAFIGNVQIDTNRINGINYNPFIVSSGTVMNVAFFVTDDSTDVQNFTINKVKISTSPDDFSSAIVYNCIYLFIPGSGGVWYTPIDCSALPQNKVLYMRYYVGDGIANNNVEFPTNASPNFYKTYFAFFIN